MVEVLPYKRFYLKSLDSLLKPHNGSGALAPPKVDEAKATVPIGYYLENFSTYSSNFFSEIRPVCVNCT